MNVSHGPETPTRRDEMIVGFHPGELADPAGGHRRGGRRSRQTRRYVVAERRQSAHASGVRGQRGGAFHTPGEVNGVGDGTSVVDVELDVTTQGATAERKIH